MGTIINLTPFCAMRRMSRYDMSKPWNRNGWKYATDGRIAVRVPCGEPDSEGQLFPPANELFGGEGIWEPWPAANYQFHETQCFVCANDLLGEIGEQRCPICNNYGYYLFVGPQEVGTHKIDSWLHHAISQLPIVEYLTGGKPVDPLPFRFDGGEGCVMGMRPVPSIDRKNRFRDVLAAAEGTRFLFGQ